MALALLRMTGVLLALGGCVHPAPTRPPPPSGGDSGIRVREVERPKEAEPVEPYRAILSGSSVLYLPPTFAPKRGSYDLLVHFHGEGRWQETNIERAKLDVAVVSVNLGVGTEPYASAFRGADAFERFIAMVQAAIAKTGRAEGATLRRIALSAWSAGFSSIASLLNDQTVGRVDAILLADGFFTSFSDVKRRTVNTAGLEKFARFAAAAEHDEKLFAITHTTIPTGPYPSVQECVTKLLEMLDLSKTPATAIGPRDLHQFYSVDRGSFHIRGFEGTQAIDHVKQLQVMGETTYPWLKARWEKQDAEDSRH